jgi:hypothetical protein
MDSIQTPPEQISRLMEGLRQGSKAAAGQLVAIFYPELRRMARACMKGERPPIPGSRPSWSTNSF